jgi:hypothetical protein
VGPGIPKLGRAPIRLGTGFVAASSVPARSLGSWPMGKTGTWLVLPAGLLAIAGNKIDKLTFWESDVVIM